MDWGTTSPIPKEVYKFPKYDLKIKDKLEKIWDVDLIDGITFHYLYDNFLGLWGLKKCSGNDLFSPLYNNDSRNMIIGKKDEKLSLDNDKILESEEDKNIIETLSDKQCSILTKCETEEGKMENGWKPVKEGDNIVYWQKAINGEPLLLGEYLPHLKKIVLYKNNILSAAVYDTTKINYCYITILVHELHHALFHYITECKLQRKFRYNYIREVEEAITEMSTLMFIEKLVEQKLLEKGCLKYAKESISNKKKTQGTLAAYGFGYYLFDKEEKNLLFKNYIKKLGDLDLKDSEVEQYTLDVCPFYPDGEAIVAKRLNDILL